MSRIDLAFLKAASFVRDRSKAGQLTSWEEIQGELKRQGLLEPQPEAVSAEWQGLIKRRIGEQEDLEEIPGPDGLPRYFSATYLSKAYARLMVQRERNPLSLLVETVREHSALYPRPVPLDLFQDPPFGMSEEEIQQCLQEMKNLEPYQDIAQTTTSIGSVFLYSTRHLDPDYASLLAEWLDVGQADHP